MSGPSDTNLNTKNTMANSLLSAAAAHSLMDEDNVLLLQDVSLQDEPEAPDTSNSGVFSNVESSSPVFELDTFVPPPGALGSANTSVIHEFKELKPEFRQDAFGQPSVAPTRPLETSAPMSMGPADVQPTVNLFTRTDTRQPTNFASALFQTFGQEKHDPFQVAIRPPPSISKVETSPGPITAPITSAVPHPYVPHLAYAGFSKSDSVTPTSINTPYSTFEYSANTTTKSEKTLGHVSSTASMALFTPSHLELTQDVRKSASSPSLLQDTRPAASAFVSPMAHATRVPASQPLPPPPSTAAATAVPTSMAYNHHAPVVPLFNPSANFGSPVPPVPSTSSSVFNPNPVIVPNSTWDGFTVLPPQGSTQDGTNQFRMTTQKPTYAQYPGINSSGMNSQPPVLDFTQPLAKLTDPQPPAPVPESLYPTLPGQDPIQYDPTMAQYAGFGGPTPPKYEPYPYYPPQYYWWYNREVDGRNSWKPFSIVDSAAIEEAFNSGSQDLVSTDGGRYDVNFTERTKVPVYWEEAYKTTVRRCSWYYKGPLDSRFVPYDEEFAVVLETEYYQTMTNGYWHKRMELGGGEVVVMHAPDVAVHFCQAASPDEWGNMPENQLRPRVVKRGVQEFQFELEEGESDQVDHLVLVVHGIGSICDFKFRNPVEAVDEFRSVSQQLSQTHFKNAIGGKRAGRIEFLPIQWHAALHGEGGADEKLKAITLNSIPKLRHFTNDTLLDILFYTSPVYTQTVVNAVANEINRIYSLFNSRHKNFNGMVALAGHSLGSLIIFDILMNQPETLPDNLTSKTTETEEDPCAKHDLFKDEDDPVEGGGDLPVAKRTRSRTVTYAVGNGGTGIQLISYPVLHFHPTAFFAMGSPIAVFVTVRGLDQLGTDFHFPTVPSFFNIFHPFDPVAYRMEPLIDPSFDLRPVLIPHHKGRKRFHLELKETMARVGTDIKNRVIESLKTTWNTVSQYASFGRSETINEDIDRAIEGELENELKEMSSNNAPPEVEEAIRLGKLNGGNRIDFVLQEAPMETLNEYLFSLSSHVCYWSSEDTVLLILKALYKKLNVHADASSTNLAIASSAPTAAPSYPIYNPADYKGPEAPPMPLSSYSVPAPANMAPSAPPLFAPSETAQPPAPPRLYSNYNSTSSASAVLPKASMKITLGARPLVSVDQYPVGAGMDPTAPISNTSIAPPPLTGFVGSRKQ